MAGHETRRGGGRPPPVENPRTSRGVDPMIILRRIASAAQTILRLWTCSFEINGLSIASKIAFLRVPGAALRHGDSLASRRMVGSGAPRCQPADAGGIPPRTRSGTGTAYVRLFGKEARRDRGRGSRAPRPHTPCPLDMIGRKPRGVPEFWRLIGHGPASYDVLDSRARFGGQIRPVGAPAGG